LLRSSSREPGLTKTTPLQAARAMWGPLSSHTSMQPDLQQWTAFAEEQARRRYIDRFERIHSAQCHVRLMLYSSRNSMTPSRILTEGTDPVARCAAVCQRRGAHLSRARRTPPGAWRRRRLGFGVCRIWRRTGISEHRRDGLRSSCSELESRMSSCRSLRCIMPGLIVTVSLCRSSRVSLRLVLGMPSHCPSQ
jgi:hypothetical protein